MMSAGCIHFLLMSAAFIALFTVSEILYHVGHVKAEYTRKFTHVGTGLLTMLFPVFFQNTWWVVALCLSFLALLTLSLRFGFLKSINAIDRRSAGSVLYPVVVIVCFCFYQYKSSFAGYQVYYSFYLPVLIMALCDPAAALVGRSLKKGPYTLFGQTKTLAGSLAFFAGACIICTLLLPAWPLHLRLAAIFVIPLVSAIAEALSQKGFDNLFIPLSVIACLIGFENML